MLEGILVGEVIKVVSPRKAIPEAGREIYISDTLCVRSHDGNENAFASMSVKAKHFPRGSIFYQKLFSFPPMTFVGVLGLTRKRRA